MKTENDELAYKITPDGETFYYKSIWEKIADEHFPECPTAVSARKHLKSTLCYCVQIEAADRAARDAALDEEIEAQDRYQEKGS